MLLLLLLLLLLVLVSGVVYAQTDEPGEWAKRIKTAEVMATLGTNLFGDSTNFYNHN